MSKWYEENMCTGGFIVHSSDGDGDGEEVWGTPQGSTRDQEEQGGKENGKLC